MHGLHAERCDCFGCCEFTKKDGSKTFALLEATCTIDALDDPIKCTKCVQSADCTNDCGHCELCVGKTELPDDCTTTGTGGVSGTGGSSGSCPAPVCPSGQQPCGLSCLAPCPSGHYCLTGCCVAVQ